MWAANSGVAGIAMFTQDPPFVAHCTLAGEEERSPVSGLLMFTVNYSLHRYDHLSECLSRVLDERPSNSVGMIITPS